MSIPTADLQSYFTQRKNRFQNKNGINFLWSENGYIHTDTPWNGLGHETYDHDDYEMRIITKWDTPESFVEHFKLEALSDIDNLEVNQVWMRYLNGLAEIVVHPLLLEADFHFSIKVFNTIVHSLDIHFFDIEYAHLTLPDDFIAYFATKEKLIQNFCNIRYKS